MTSMIERVARAIDECPEWPAKTYRERTARAAIEAMRVPTDLMLMEGGSATNGIRYAGKSMAAAVHAAMIDAALGEE